uniref:Uncharacterized protein n=1 Tax=Leersia perrieri TaxID=77586 RepID=A0A0D9XCN2_9ORYZ
MANGLRNRTRQILSPSRSWRLPGLVAGFVGPWTVDVAWPIQVHRRSQSSIQRVKIRTETNILLRRLSHGEREVETAGAAFLSGERARRVEGGEPGGSSHRRCSAPVAAVGSHRMWCPAPRRCCSCRSGGVGEESLGFGVLVVGMGELLPSSEQCLAASTGAVAD